MTCKQIVDRDIVALCLRVVCGDLCGGGEVEICRLAPLGDEKHVRSRRLSRVEPIVLLFCKTVGDVFVLNIVLSAKHSHSVGGLKLHNDGGFLLVCGVILHSRRVSRAEKLVAYLREVCGRLCASKRLEHRVDILKLALADLDLLCKLDLCGLALGVFFVKSLRVCGYRHSRVKLNSELRAIALLVHRFPVLKLDEIRLFGQAVEICGDEITVFAIGFTLVARLQLASLKLELLTYSRLGVRQETKDVGRALMNSLLVVAACEIRVEKRACALKALYFVRAVLRDRDKGIFNALLTVLHKAGRKNAVLYCLGYARKFFPEIVRKAISHGRVGVARRAENYLSCDHGRNAHKGCDQKLVARALTRRIRYEREKFLLGHVERIDLSHSRRKLVDHSGQELAHAVEREIRGAHGGYYFFVTVCKNKVTVLSHQLDDEISAALKAHFVSRLKAEKGNSVEVRLIYLDKLRTLQIFAQKHTEHRRILRIFLLYLGKTDTRIVRARVDQQALAALKGAHLQNYLVSLRLIYLFNSCAESRFSQLRERTGEHSRIKSHK